MSELADSIEAMMQELKAGEKIGDYAILGKSSTGVDTVWAEREKED